MAPASRLQTEEAMSGGQCCAQAAHQLWIHGCLGSNLVVAPWPRHLLAPGFCCVAVCLCCLHGLRLLLAALALQLLPATDDAATAAMIKVAIALACASAAADASPEACAPSCSVNRALSFVSLASMCALSWLAIASVARTHPCHLQALCNHSLTVTAVIANPWSAYASAASRAHAWTTQGNTASAFENPKDNACLTYTIIFDITHEHANQIHCIAKLLDL